MKTCYCCMSKENLVTSWRAQNPAGSKNRCARELGIDIKTVRKWWDSAETLLSQAEETEIPDPFGEAETDEEWSPDDQQELIRATADFANMLTNLVEVEDDLRLVAMRQLLRAVIALADEKDDTGYDDDDIRAILDAAIDILNSADIDAVFRQVNPNRSEISRYAVEQFGKYKRSESALGDSAEIIPDLCVLALERNRHRN